MLLNLRLLLLHRWRRRLEGTRWLLNLLLLSGWQLLLRMLLDLRLLHRLRRRLEGPRRLLNLLLLLGWQLLL
jgi:hypothetical protein